MALLTSMFLEGIHGAAPRCHYCEKCAFISNVFYAGPGRRVATKRSKTAKYRSLRTETGR